MKTTKNEKVAGETKAPKKVGAVREFVGKVLSTATKDTITVEVERFVLHPKYGKPVRKTKHFAVHAPGAKVNKGDVVTIRATRPVSKTKHFMLMEK